MAERTCGSGLTKTHCHQWLLSFYTYPANCPGKYLSSLVFTARICQVYVSGSVGTDVQCWAREFLCNLLTRDFAYLSILYGSRREMPTALIDCIVHFFIFCWELLLMVQVK